MVKEYFIMLVKVNMKVIIKNEKKMEKGFFIIMMEIFIMEIGKMIKETEKDF